MNDQQVRELLSLLGFDLTKQDRTYVVVDRRAAVGLLAMAATRCSSLLEVEERFNLRNAPTASDFGGLR